MRIRVALIATLLASITSPCRAQTRARQDSANTLRRCDVQRGADEPADQYAIRCAEHFVAEQGYTASSPTPDTNRVVPEGIEWSASKAQWLARRRGTLASHAVGVCIGPDNGRYTVVFRDPRGGGARGVTLDAAFGSLRVEHQAFRFEVVQKEQYGCHTVPGRQTQ